jgi:phosphonate transport system substrate-binding protein
MVPMRRRLRTRSVRLALAASIVAAAVAMAAPPAPEPAGGEPDPLRLGAVGFYNPRLMYLKYQALVDYLSDTTGRRWELVIGAGYQGTVDALCAGDLTLAYLGPWTYVRAHDRCGVEPVARLQTGGSATYHSLILVRDDAPFEAVADLEGARIGFGAPLSTSSHLMPRAMLLAAGLEPASYECRFYGHHERAARAVLLGEVDACGVRDAVGYRAVQRGLRVLATSEPIPNFPIVAAPGLPADLLEAIDDALVRRPQQDAEVAARMRAWDAEIRDGFARCGDADYDATRAVVASVLGAAGLRMAETGVRSEAGCR